MEEQTTATTLPPKMYGILTEGEFNELKQKLSEITTNLPTHLTGYIWGTYNRIKGTNEPQPCNCKSSGGLWAGAVEFLRSYVNDIVLNDK